MLIKFTFGMALDEIVSTLCIKIWNQFFTCMRNLVPIFQMCDKTVTDSSHM